MNEEAPQTFVDQLNDTRALCLTAEGDTITMTLVAGDEVVVRLGKASRYELESVFVSGATIVPASDFALVGFRMQMEGAKVKFSKEGGVFAIFDAAAVKEALFPRDGY